jgi:hypothetical protein
MGAWLPFLLCQLISIGRVKRPRTKSNFGVTDILRFYEEHDFLTDAGSSVSRPFKGFCDREKVDCKLPLAWDRLKVENWAWETP